MVLGKKYDIEADVMYQKIIKIEENIISIQKKLSEVRWIATCTYWIAYRYFPYSISGKSNKRIQQWQLFQVTKEVKDIEDGFLSKEHHSEALKGLTKRCKVCIEEFMGSLESLDELQFEEHQSIAKSKRKSVVKETNNHLDHADETLKRIEAQTSK